MVSINTEQQQEGRGGPGEPPSRPVEGNDSALAERAGGHTGDPLHRKFLHSAGGPGGTPGTDAAAVRGERGSPLVEKTARSGWQPMTVGGDFSATWAKFLHMQHRARSLEAPEPASEDKADNSFSASSACTQLGKRRRETPEQGGGEDAATALDRPASCSPPEKSDLNGDCSPTSSEHPLSINSAASELHSVTRAEAQAMPGDDIAAADEEGALPGV